MSILAACLKLVRALPFSLAVAASRLLLLTYFMLSPRVRAEIAANYRRIFPEEATACTSRACGRFLVRLSWNLGRNLAVMAQMGRPALEKWLDNAIVSGENIVERIMLGGEKVIVTSLHYGLWELLPGVFARRGYRVCVGLGRQRDAVLDGVVREIRSEHDVTMTDSVPRMRAALREGSLLGFVLDNSNRTRGLDCAALGEGFRLLRTPFSLSRVDGARLVPMFATQTRGRLRIDVLDPVDSSEEFGARARELIRARPEDWVFWGKN